MTEDKAILVISASINKENMSELPTYLTAIGAIFAKNDGIPVGKYKAIEQLVGEQGPNVVAIIQFPNSDTIKAIVNGEDFKGLAEIRARIFSKLNMTICGDM